jgi:hypothetical protein
MVHFPLTTVTFAESLHFGFRFHLEVLEAWKCWKPGTVTVFAGSTRAADHDRPSDRATPQCGSEKGCPKMRGTAHLNSRTCLVIFS